MSSAPRKLAGKRAASKAEDESRKQARLDAQADVPTRNGYAYLDGDPTGVPEFPNKGTDESFLPSQRASSRGAILIADWASKHVTSTYPAIDAAAKYIAIQSGMPPSTPAKARPPMPCQGGVEGVECVYETSEGPSSDGDSDTATLVDRQRYYQRHTHRPRARQGQEGQTQDQGQAKRTQGVSSFRKKSACFGLPVLWSPLCTPILTFDLRRLRLFPPARTVQPPRRHHRGPGHGQGSNDRRAPSRTFGHILPKNTHRFAALACNGRGQPLTGRFFLCHCTTLLETPHAAQGAV